MAVNFAFAQSKMLTMEEAILGARKQLAPQNITQLKWIKGSADYSWLDTLNKSETLLEGNVSKTGNKAIVSLRQLNTQLRSGNFDTLPVFPLITWLNVGQFSFTSGKKIMRYDGANQVLSVLETRNIKEGAENMDEDSASHHVAYTIGNNLFIWDGNKNIQVTNDKDENLVNGHSVHREEFGIFKGTFWGPGGNLLAFYRMDQTMVTDYPVLDLTQRPAKANLIKYPMAGDKSHEVTLGVYDLTTGKTIFIQTGEPKEQYLTNVAWDPGGQKIYIAVLNRDQNHLLFNCYNASSGEFEKTLFEETSDKYVQPLHPMLFVKNKPTQFIWQSRRDGFNHLYLYDTGGNLISQLTKGEWEVTDFLGFDEKGEKAYYLSTAESPVNRDLYNVNLKSGKISRLTSGNGTHAVSVNTFNDCVIDNFSSTDTPRNIQIINSSGKTIKTLLAAENPLKDYNLGAMKIFTVNNSEGTELYCRMYLPVNFDSTKKYPVIVYVYGGPNVQLITNAWNGGAGDLWFQYMAEHGYIVFTLDNRGSANRGLKFEQAIFRNLGTPESLDQITGVQYLKSLPYVDAGRIGLHGWSFGGFMTCTLMTKFPDVFKAAVAGGPVIDWSYYEVMYTERYMDTPQTNPEGYHQSALENYVNQLKGNLLLIHGTADDVVVWQQSLMFLKKAVDDGVQVDYFVYPGHPHNVRGKDRVHLMTKVSDYFFEHLK